MYVMVVSLKQKSNPRQRLAKHRDSFAKIDKQILDCISLDISLSDNSPTWIQNRKTLDELLVQRSNLNRIYRNNTHNKNIESD